MGEENEGNFWSARLRHFDIDINGNSAELKNKSRNQGPCILGSQRLSGNATWAIKIDKQLQESIGIGVALQSVLAANRFVINHHNKGHGLYIMWATGYTYSFHDSKINCQFRGFKFGQCDIITLNFYEKQNKLRFQKGKKKYELELIEAPPGDAYRAVATFLFKGDLVTAIKGPD